MYLFRFLLTSLCDITSGYRVTPVTRRSSGDQRKMTFLDLMIRFMGKWARGIFLWCPASAWTTRSQLRGFPASSVSLGDRVLYCGSSVLIMSLAGRTSVLTSGLLSECSLITITWTFSLLIEISVDTALFWFPGLRWILCQSCFHGVWSTSSPSPTLVWFQKNIRQGIFACDCVCFFPPAFSHTATFY